MKSIKANFVRRTISIFCALVLLAAPVPFARLLAGATEVKNPKRQVLDFEDSSNYSFAENSGLELDGLQDGKGYLYCENTASTTQYIELGRNANLFTAGAAYTISLDFNTLQMPTDSCILEVEALKSDETVLNSQKCKQAFFEEENAWYHVDLSFTAADVGTFVRFLVSGGANVVFDNITVTDASNVALAVDVETAAYNTVYFDWIFKDSTVTARKNNQVLHITTPTGGAAHTFTIGGDEIGWKNSLTANAQYTLQFDYYYTDNGYSAEDISSELISVYFSANTNKESRNCISNYTVDLAAVQPKMGAWQTASISFTATQGKSPKIPYYQRLSFTVGSGVDIMIDNIRFIDKDGQEVAAATWDFSQSTPVYVDKALTADADSNLFEIGEDIAVDFVDNWVASVKNGTDTQGVTYIEDEKLALQAAKSYYVRMQAFIGRNAKDTDGNTENFALQLGEKKLNPVEIDQLAIDQWVTYTSEIFTGVTDAWLAVLSQPGLVAYFDNIEIVDAATNEPLKTFTVTHVNWEKNANGGTVGEMLARSSVKAGLSKNVLLHINTPKKSKDTSVLDVKFTADALPQLGLIEAGEQYYITFDMYYFANEGYDKYDGEMANNLPTMRLGFDYSDDGNPLCDVFTATRDQYLNTDGRYYDTWFTAQSDVFTATAGMKGSLSLKTWCGTECYIDNITMHEAESGDTVYVIDFEDSPEYITYNESIGTLPAAPKGSYSVESGPEVVFVDNALYVHNTTAGAQKVYIEDSNVQSLTTGQHYHIEAEAYVVNPGSGKAFEFGISTTTSRVFDGNYASNVSTGKWCNVKTDSLLIPDGETCCWTFITAAIGFEGYFDNVKIINDDTGKTERCFTIATIDEANLKDVGGKSIGKVVDRSAIGKSSGEYSLKLFGQTATVTDETFEYLKKDIAYRLSFNYYITSAGNADILLSANFGNSAENGFVMYATDNRTAGRWETASAVLTVSDKVSAITFSAGEGTDIYIDDLTVTDIETNETMVYMLFNDATTVAPAAVLNAAAPDKSLITVTEPDFQAGYLRVGGEADGITALLGADNAQGVADRYNVEDHDGGAQSLNLISGATYSVSFDFYRAQAGGNIGDTVCTVSVVDSILVPGAEKNQITQTKLDAEDNVWQNVSFEFTVGNYNSCNWLQFVMAPGALVYIDDLVVQRVVAETNQTYSVLDFEESDFVENHVTAPTTDALASAKTTAEIEAMGFSGNGSNGYLYLDNKAGTNTEAVANYQLTGIKLEDDTDYAVTFHYCSTKATGNAYGIAFGYSNVDETNNISIAYNYINQIEVGWNSFTMFFETGTVPHAENYLNIAVYGTYDFVFDNIYITPIHNPEPTTKAVLDFESEDNAYYPAQNNFRWASRSEIKAAYPGFEDETSSKGYLYSCDNHPRLQVSENGKTTEKVNTFDLRGIGLRSSTVYEVSFRYQVLVADTIPEDGINFNFYLAFGSNNGTGVASDFNASTFISDKDENKWYNCTTTFTTTDDVTPDKAYFRIYQYQGCALLIDDFTVTAKVSDYGDLLFCEDIYSQFENADFEAEITDENWGPLPNGMSVVADAGGDATLHGATANSAGKKAAGNVLQIDGNALDGRRYTLKKSLVSNTNYILSAWVKADADSDVTVGLFGSKGGRTFTTMYNSENGYMDFPRDGNWHRVNLAFNSGKFDECYLDITGTAGIIYLDGLDFYLASQGLNYDPTDVKDKSIEMRYVESDALTPYGDVIITKRTVECEEDVEVTTTGPTTTTTTTTSKIKNNTKTDYTINQSLSTWEDVTEETSYTNPEVGIKRKKVIVQTGGGISTGGIIAIAAGGVFVACAALFVILLLTRKRKPEGK